MSCGERKNSQLHVERNNYWAHKSFWYHVTVLFQSVHLSVSIPFHLCMFVRVWCQYFYLFSYLLQLGCYPVAVVILHVNKT